MTKKIIWKIIDGVEWCYDENNNRNSVECWGSRKDAEKALNSLVNCKDCSDCSYCSYCSDCSDCSDYSGKKDNEERKEK